MIETEWTSERKAELEKEFTAPVRITFENIGQACHAMTIERSKDTQAS